MIWKWSRLTWQLTILGECFTRSLAFQLSSAWMAINQSRRRFSAGHLPTTCAFLTSTNTTIQNLSQVANLHRNSSSVSVFLANAQLAVRRMNPNLAVKFPMTYPAGKLKAILRASAQSHYLCASSRSTTVPTLWVLGGRQVRCVLLRRLLLKLWIHWELSRNLTTCNPHVIII